MKAIMVIVGLCVFASTAYNQTITFPDNKTEITVKEDLKNPMHYSFSFPIANGTATPITLTISDPETGTADLGRDYAYENTVIGTHSILDPLTDIVTVAFVIKPNRIKRENTFFNIFFLIQSGPKPILQTLKVNIESANPAEPKLVFPDTSKFSVKFITGSNFDFFDAPVFKNFAGEINVFLPGLIEIKRGTKPSYKIGFQAGGFNYRYFDADSSNGNIQNEKYLLDPTVRQVNTGITKYVNDIYALNSKMDYNTFGAYFNPMINLSTGKIADVYVNLHFEWLGRTQTLQYNRSNIRKDTLTYTTQDSAQRIVLQGYPGLRPTYTRKTFNDLYYGVGMPVKINIRNTFLFYICPTIGYSTFNRTTYDDEILKGLILRTYTTENVVKPFFLCKFQLTTTVAPIDIVLGGEFRQVSGNNSFFALYLGGALSIDKLKH